MYGRGVPTRGVQGAYIPGGVPTGVYRRGERGGAYIPGGVPTRRGTGRHIRRFIPSWEAKGGIIGRFIPSWEAKRKHNREVYTTQGG